MTNKDVIDGWKSISMYIGKSAKTIQRWERESGFPIHRVPGRRSVFALKEEVDRWMEYQTKEKGNFRNESVTETGSFDLMLRSRRVLPIAFVVIMVLLGVFVVQSQMPSQAGKNPVIGPLTATIVPYSEGSLLTVRNGLGTQVLNRKFKNNWTEFALHTPGSCVWKIEDVNRDGLDDFVLLGLEESIPGIDVFLQQPDGSLTLERKLSVKETIRYQKTTFKMGRIQYFELKDLDGDHVPELLISVDNSVLYPALLVVMTLKGERLLVMEHPGWFRNVQVRNVDGKPVVYAAGTNNFITKYSEPVVIRVSMDWHRRGVRFSLLRSNRKMAESVPEGISLTYARLGDFPESPGVSPWEPAVLRPERWGADGKHIMLDVGYYDSRKGKAALPGSGPLQEIRQYKLNEDLSLIYATFNDVVVDVMDIKPETEPFHSLLKPHYWNGNDWQGTVCTVPQK